MCFLTQEDKMSSLSVTAPRTVSQARRGVFARALAKPGLLFAAALFLAVLLVEAIAIAIGAPSVAEITALYAFGA